MKKIILDKYEQSVEKALERGDYVPVKNLAKSKKMFEEAAQNYLELHKTKSITLRVNNEVLIKVKVKAKRSGIPYQRLIGALLHQYAEEKIRLTI